MKKIFSNIAEYLALAFASILIMFLIFITAIFVWLSDNQKKEIPQNFLDTFNKIYSNHNITINSYNSKIQLDNNYSLNIQSELTIKHKDKTVFNTKALTISFHLKKIKDFHLPYDININSSDIAIQDLKYDNDAFETFSKNSVSLLKLASLKISDTNATIGDSVYQINQHIDFLSTSQNISIQSKNKTQKSINIAWQRPSQNHITIKAQNIPLNVFNQILPTSYKPKIFNQSSALLAIHIDHSSVKTNFNIVNTSQDKVVNTIDIRGSNQHNSIFNIDFKINLLDQFGQFSGQSNIEFTKNFLFQHNTSVLFNIDASSINLSNLDQLWPETVEKQTRDWLVSSMKKGLVNKASLKLHLHNLNHIKDNHLNAHLKFSNLTLDYFDQHIPITNASGDAYFNLNQVKIDIKQAKMGQADLENSNVIIKYSEPDTPLIIYANASGDLNNFLHLGNGNKGSILHKRGVNLKKAHGHTTLKTEIIIPLDKDISIENTTINTSGQIFDLKLKDKHLNINSTKLNLKIEDHTLNVVGNIKINGQDSSMTWISNLISKNHFDNQISINTTITPSSELSHLLQNKVNVHEGEILSNFLYTNKDTSEKIYWQLNLDKSSFSIPDIGLTKNLTNDAKLDIEMETTDQGTWKSKRIAFLSKSKNIKLTSTIELSNNFTELIYLLLDLSFANNDLNILFDKNQNKESLSVRSKYIDLSDSNLANIFNLIAKENKQKTKATSISLQLDNVKVKNSIYFTNVLGHFDCKKSVCSNSALSMMMGKTTKLNIRLLNKKGKNFWIIQSNNAAQFLKGLNIYQNIEGGALTIRLTNTTKNPHKPPSFKGTFQMTNFNAVKTPLLAKLIIQSPFSSLIKTLEGKDLLTFENMEGSFVTNDQTITIEHAFATGSLLTATLQGVVNYKNDTIHIKGKLIPKSILNSVLNHQTEHQKGDALIATKYRIVGKITEPEVRVDPLGALLSLITQFPLRII